MPKGRPDNLPHNAASLRQLAKRFDEAKKSLEKVADELETAAGSQSVKVAFQISVDDGLKSLGLLVGDVRKKIDQGKFLDVKVSLPPAKAATKMAKKKAL